MNTPDDLNALFTGATSGVAFPGPFPVHEVVLHGHIVPYLHATPTEAGVCLTLDRRYALDVSAGDVGRLIPFIADCIAVAMGYTGHPKPDCPTAVQRPPFPRMERVRLIQPG